MIEVDGLTRYYDELCAVSDLSFAVAPGEVLGLVGQNGAGKTTCLHCLSGIIAPDRGRVRIGGVDLGRHPVPAKRQLAFIPDTPLLFEYLTVIEHLNFVARVFEVADWEARAEALLAEFELGDKRDELPDALSRGMKQKLAICAAFLHEPQAIFCDEPLTGLDPVGIRNMRASLRRRADGGAALILSSHQLELVSALCDRILIIHEGRELVSGTMAEVRGRYPDLGGGATLEDLFLAAIGKGDVAPEEAPAELAVEAAAAVDPTEGGAPPPAPGGEGAGAPEAGPRDGA